MKQLLPFFLLFSAGLLQAQNPRLIKNLAGTVTQPGSAFESPDFWKNNQWNGLFFYLGTGTPSKLCITDGTDAGTRYLADIGTGTIHKIIPAKDFVYIITTAIISPSPYTLRYEMWKSDGTAAGTVLIRVLPDVVGITNGGQFTSNVQSTFNYSLDGTTNKMYFSTFDAANGNELWVSDGTTAGTSLLKDIKPGVGGSFPWGFMKIGNEVFFNCMEVGLERKLWKTDGTPVGTVRVSVPEPFFIVNGNISKLGSKMLFFANNTTDGFEPYVSDGTTAGTFMLGNFNTTTTNSGNSLLPYVDEANLVSNSKYCFLVLHNGTDSSLYRTDGTPAGTIRVAPAGMSIYARLTSGGNVDINESGIWVLQNNVSGNGNARKLFRSDGTVAGTYMVFPNVSYGEHSKIYKNALWMRARNTGSVSNVEPWRSGGNQATTNKAFEIAPGGPFAGVFYSSDPFGFFVTNNRLYFFAKNTASSPGLYEYNGDFTFNGSVAGGNWSDSANWNSAMPPGITDTVFINTGTPNATTVTNTKAYAGTLILGNNASVAITNGSDSLYIATELSPGVNNSFTGNGVLVSNSFNANTVQFKNGLTANNVSVESNTNLLNGTIAVNNGMTLLRGKLTLNTGNLLLKGNTSTVSAFNGNFVITNSTGAMQVENIGSGARTGTILFPIGTAAAYNPVNFSNTGTSDVFGARVTEGISTTYTGETPGSFLSSNAVNRTWFLNEGMAGGSNATIGLQWNGADELPGFDRNQAVLGHFTGGAWSVNGAGAAGGSNPYTYSRAGITSFSPFGILNSVATAVSEWQQNAIRLHVYPNPVQDVAQVELPLSLQRGVLQLQLLNAAGTLVLQQQVTVAQGSLLRLNVSGLSQGVYYLLIRGKSINASTILTKIK